MTARDCFAEDTGQEVCYGSNCRFVSRYCFHGAAPVSPASTGPGALYRIVYMNNVCDSIVPRTWQQVLAEVRASMAHVRRFPRSSRMVIDRVELHPMR